jgi:hypothetical protein
LFKNDKFISKENFNISCDFDIDLCGYEINEFMQRYSGKSPSLSSGPFGDYTTGLFFFLSISYFFSLCFKT